MTARRSPGKTQPATWKDPRRRPELLKAIGAGAAVVLGTALIIFFVRPGDSTTTTPTPVPVQNPVPSLPTESTPGSIPTDSIPTDSIPTDSTGTTATTGPSTTPTQP